MKSSLDRLSIKGFRSIRELNDFELHSLNVIIGANGAGKSNLIAFFKMLRAFIDGNLNRYVRDNGGVIELLFNGSKVTQKMEFEAYLSSSGFRFKLVPTFDGGFAIEDEAYCHSNSDNEWRELGDSADGKLRMVADVVQGRAGFSYAQQVYETIASWQVYHFHDTSAAAPMRKYEIVQDNQVLRADAANIGPFLLKLKNQYPISYQAIVKTIRLALPFFDDFILEPRMSGAKEEVNISWQQNGSDDLMQPCRFSDGSLRFICLATVLLQPEPPATIVIDEPELGLNPYAITLLGSLISSASVRTQVLVSTQSVTLLNEFEIDDLIVVNLQEEGTVLKRLDKTDFASWLEDYTIGELWQKNILGGRPSR